MDEVDLPNNDQNCTDSKILCMGEVPDGQLQPQAYKKCTWYIATDDLPPSAIFRNRQSSTDNRHVRITKERATCILSHLANRDEFFWLDARNYDYDYSISTCCVWQCVGKAVDTHFRSEAASYLYYLLFFTLYIIGIVGVGSQGSGS